MKPARSSEIHKMAHNKRMYAQKLLLSQTVAFRTVPFPSCSIFCILAPELIVEIAWRVCALNNSSGCGVDLVELENSIIDSRHLLLTCKYISECIRSTGSRICMELACRRATQLVPARWDKVIPFTLQFKSELRSQTILNFFEFVCTSMAIHCAKQHCFLARKCINRDSMYRSRNCSIRVLHTTSVNIAACELSPYVFLISEVRSIRPKGKKHRLQLLNTCQRPVVWSSMSELACKCTMDIPFSVMKISACPYGSGVLLQDKAGSLYFGSNMTHEPTPGGLELIYSHENSANVHDFWFCHEESGVLFSIFFTEFRIQSPFYMDESVNDIAIMWSGIRHHYEINTLANGDRWVHENQRELQCNPCKNARGTNILIQRIGQMDSGMLFEEVVLFNTIKETEIVIRETGTRQPDIIILKTLNSSSSIIVIITDNGSGCGVAEIYRKSYTCDAIYNQWQNRRPLQEIWTIVSNISLSNCARNVISEPRRNPTSAFATFSPCGRFVMFMSSRLRLNGIHFIDATLVNYTNNPSIKTIYTIEDQTPREIQWTDYGLFVRTQQNDALLLEMFGT